MKILIVSPWENRWIGYMKTWFEAKGHEVQWTDSPKPVAFLRWADIVVFGWANELTAQITQLPFKFVPYVCFVRSYELFETCIARQVNWENIDHQVFVNPYFSKVALQQGVLKDGHFSFIPNALDLDAWPFFDDAGIGSKIAFVADISFKKGLQLLAQIMMALPDHYTLHMAGKTYDGSARDMMSFKHILDETGVAGRVFIDGHIENLSGWLRDKNYLLSTSQVEGCPNNVIEAMALGIKPIVFNWPGAKLLFGDEITFNTVDEAVARITNEAHYDPNQYRDYVVEHFAMDAVYPKLLELFESLTMEVANVQNQG